MPPASVEGGASAGGGLLPTDAADPEAGGCPRLPLQRDKRRPSVAWESEQDGTEGLKQQPGATHGKSEGRRAGILATIFLGSVKLVAAWWTCLKKLWLLRDARGTLICTLLVLVVQTCGAIHTLVNPCLLSPDMFNDDCDVALKLLIGIQIGTVGLMTTMVNVELFPKVSVAQRQQLGRGGDYRQGQLSGWAAASSKSVFEEVVRVTRQGQLQLLMFVGVFNVVMMIGFTMGDVAVWDSPHYRAYLSSTCGPDADWWSACTIAWKFKDAIAITVSTSNSYFCGLLCGIRTEMWTSAFDFALRRTNTKWLLRCLRVHWLTLPYGVTMLFVFSMTVKIKFMTATAAEMTAYTYVSGIHIFSFMLCTAWTLDLDSVLRRKVQSATACLFKGRNSVWAFPDVPIADTTGFWPGEAEEPAAAATPSTQKAKRASLWAYLRDTRGGFKHRQLQLLINVILLMLVQPLGSPLSMGLVWAFRLIVILMVLNTDDTPSSFSDLSPQEASFGLLLNASHLKAALAAFHRGEEYSGPLMMTRATYYRMDDTLAVSYRWQNYETRVCEGLTLNMSGWQLEELERAVCSSGCLYAWIDRVALPQRTCGLQVTLLARMMALFATTRKTLALRGLEVEGSRYHQRAWILQEFCNARELIMVTQSDDDDKSAASRGLSAVDGDEEAFFQGIREWHQERWSSCYPYWLYGVGGDAVKENIRKALDKFRTLSSRLVCSFEVDKVRALYPLLFNTPCENHEELQQLVHDVAEVASEVRRSRSGITYRNFLAEVEESERILEDAYIEAEAHSMRVVLSQATTINEEDPS